MAWRLAKSLIKLRDQINQIAPHRNKLSDGTIGDQAHASRKSEHNPNAQGVVTAMDITHDPVNGVDGATLSKALIADPRTWYVIFNGMIWKSKTGKWEPYRGSNPHRKHAHVSVKPDRYDNEEPWPLSVSPPVPKNNRKVLKRGDRGPEVEELQRKLRKWVNISVDGIFGQGTENAVKYFQRSEGLEADGKVGPLFWKALEGK